MEAEIIFASEGCGEIDEILSSILRQNYSEILLPF